MHGARYHYSTMASSQPCPSSKRMLSSTTHVPVASRYMPGPVGTKGDRDLRKQLATLSLSELYKRVCDRADIDQDALQEAFGAILGHFFWALS